MSLNMNLNEPIGVCDECGKVVEKMMHKKKGGAYICSSCYWKEIRKNSGRNSNFVYLPAGADLPHVFGKKNGKYVDKWNVIPVLDGDPMISSCAGDKECFIFKNRGYHCARHKKEIVHNIGEESYAQVFLQKKH